MQVYRRIANPYMPQGTANLTNAPTPLYAPGEVGCAFTEQVSGGAYLRVYGDSGAAAGSVAPAAYKLAYWKDQANNLVTSDPNQCDVGPAGCINRVAGVIQTPWTCAPGVNDSTGQPIKYAVDLIIGKKNTPVYSASALIGAQATVNTSGQAAYTTGVNTAPVSQVIGVFASSTIGSPGPANTAPIDVNIGFTE